MYIVILTGGTLLLLLTAVHGEKTIPVCREGDGGRESWEGGPGGLGVSNECPCPTGGALLTADPAPAV